MRAGRDRSHVVDRAAPLLFAFIPLSTNFESSSASWPQDKGVKREWGVILEAGLFFDAEVQSSKRLNKNMIF